MFNRVRLRTIAVAGVAALAVPAASLMISTSAQAEDLATYKGKVIASSLAVRSLPTTYGWKRASLAKGTTVTIQCKLNAVNVDGNRRWYRLGANGWVSARYVSNLGAAPTWCTDVSFPVAQVTKKPTVNLRQAPTNTSKLVGSLEYGANARVMCKVNGPSVGGNPRWYQLVDGRWVTARYMANVDGVPGFCGAHTT